MSTEPDKAEAEEARLTAYVLGELPPGEIESVEEHLEKSAAARRSVEEVRETVRLLEAEFSNAPVLRLHEEQLEAITGKAGGGGKGGGVPDGKVVRGSFGAWWGGLAVAACAGLFAVVGMRDYLSGLEDRDRMAESGAVAEQAQADDPQPAAGSLDKSAEGGRALGLDQPIDVEPDALPFDGAAATLAERALDSPGDPSDRERTLGSQRPGAPMTVDAGAPSPREGEPAKPAEARMKKEVNRVPKEAVVRSSAVPSPEPAVPHSRQRRQLPPEPKVEAEMLQTLEKGVAASRGVPEEPQPEVEADADGGLPQRDKDKTDQRRELLDEQAEKRVGGGVGGETFGSLVDNPWVAVERDNKSTLATDVDTGTYPNVRRYLTRQAALPPRDAVRIEEMINYFDYDYPEPDDGESVAVIADVASCPWEKGQRLVRVGIKAKDLVAGKRPPSNLVFLIDVSGSMRGPEKLGLLKRSMKALVDQLGEDDSIAIVTYAGESGVPLEPTNGGAKEQIHTVLDKLEAGGSTNGSAGLKRAYELAKGNLVEGGTNRVILATDGDFNGGITDKGELVRLVEEHAGEQIYLTVLGFGSGNLKEERIEYLADKGNGSYHYIDSEREGEKVLVSGLGSTLVTVAKNVKLQVTFNPERVERFRLIGYANRILPHAAHHDAEADAGEMGAGHTVTALYQLVPKPAADPAEAKLEGQALVDRETARLEFAADPEALFKVSVKSQDPQAAKLEDHEEIVRLVPDSELDWSMSGEDFRFAAAVAGFGLLLRDSDYAGLLNYDLVIELGEEGIPAEGDALGLRREFIDLVKRAKSLSEPKD